MRFVGVGKRLEVGEILIGPAVTALVEFDAFLDLLADAFFWTAIGGIEGLVAAEGAASRADLAVTVGTAEAGIDADFLDAGAEQRLEVLAIGIVAGHGAKIQKNWDYFMIPFRSPRGPLQTGEPSEPCSAQAFSMSHRHASKLAGGTP